MLLIVLTGMIIGTIAMLNFYIYELAQQAKGNLSGSYKRYPSSHSSRQDEKSTKKETVKPVDVSAVNLDKLLEGTVQSSLKRKAPDLYKMDTSELRTIYKKWEDTYLGPLIYQVRREKVREALQERKIRKRYIADIKTLHEQAMYSYYPTKHLKQLLNYYLAHQPE